MTEAIQLKIAWAIAAVIAYGLFRWRWMSATHDFRARVGREADRWAEDPRVDPKVRESIVLLADAAYRPATPWIILLGVIVGMVSSPGRPHAVRLSDDPEVSRKLVVLKLKLLLALITTSPLASMFAVMFAVVAVVVAVLAHGSFNTIRDGISEAGDRFFPRKVAGH